MRKIKNFFLIILFCSGLLLVSCDYTHDKPAAQGPIFPNVWDYTSLHEVIVDSTTTPYTVVIHDTAFDPHTQYSYRSYLRLDTVNNLEVTYYDVLPNLVKSGHCYFTNNAKNNIVILLPPDNPDTLNYFISIAGNSLFLTHTISSPGMSNTYLQFFSQR